MAAILRLNTSCIGRGFFLNNGSGGFCPGNGDPCTECTGVREDDWKKRASGFPHDLAWVLDQNPTVPGNCGAVLVPPTPFNAGPCARGTHCEGTIIGEAVWDLLKRDLPCHTKGWESPPGGPVAGGRCKGLDPNPTLDENTALVLGSRLYYLAGGGVVMGYQCDVRVGGCNADSWYMGFLAADDDDGNLADGTPHMSAIYDTFRRHGIACRVPAAMNFGCAATPAPTAKPVVTATAGARSASLTWTAVPNAAEYWILRTDGVHGCNFGKTRVGRIAATAPRTFTQNDLLDGLTYYYSVVPVGGLVPAGVGADACAGLMSDCASVVPLPPAEPPGPCLPPANRPPTAVDDAVSVPRNRAKKLSVLANDTDPDFDTLTVGLTAPAHGVAVINADRTVTYAPSPDFEGTDGFDYVVSDGRGGSDTGHITLTVGGDPCAAGFTVLTDPAGDASTQRPEHDVRSASIAQTPDGKFVFILEMSGMSAPTPNVTNVGSLARSAVDDPSWQIVPR